MMKILCISLLLTTAFVSVCLSASLVDDQLAQILGEKLQSDSMTDQREYASIEDINEFERRLAALEKLGEVTDQLFPDNTPEEYVGGPVDIQYVNTDSLSGRFALLPTTWIIRTPGGDTALRKYTTHTLSGTRHQPVEDFPVEMLKSFGQRGRFNRESSELEDNYAYDNYFKLKFAIFGDICGKNKECHGK